MLNPKTVDHLANVFEELTARQNITNDLLRKAKIHTKELKLTLVRIEAKKDLISWLIDNDLEN